MVRRLFLPLIAALIAVPAAVSQPAAAPREMTYEQAWIRAFSVQQRYAKGYATVGYAPAILTVPDHPFTASRVYTEWARDAGDEPDEGSAKPVVTTTVTIARDSLGRIHYESSRESGRVVVLISDPVEHVHYQYEISPETAKHRVAHRCTEPLMSQISRPNTPPAVGAVKPAPPPEPAIEVPKSTREELGTRQIEGALAFGQQRTNYFAVKAKLTTMRTEDWFSPEVGLNLREVNDFSGQNKYSLEVHDLKIGEPDANLFQLPVGYLLPDQTESCVKLIDDPR